LLHKSLVL